MVLLQIKGIISLDSSTNSWVNSDHEVTVIEYWRERQQNICKYIMKYIDNLYNVNSTIAIVGVEDDNPTDLNIMI